MEEQKEVFDIEQIVYSVPGTITNYSELGLKQPLVIEIMKVNTEIISMLEQNGIEALMGEQDVIISAPINMELVNIITISLCQLVDTRIKQVQGILLCPRRELAYQFAQYLSRLGKGIGIRVQLLVGGRRIIQDIVELRQIPHLVVGTPGRVNDLVSKNFLKINNLQYLFFADIEEIMSIGFSETISELIRNAPITIKSALFSVYFATATQEFIKNFIKLPVKKVTLKQLSLNSKNKIVGNFLIEVRNEEFREKALLEQLLQYDSPVGIFCNSTVSVLKLSRTLKAQGIPCIALHDLLSSEKRKSLLSTSPATKHIVCTDSYYSIPQIQQSRSIINYSIPLIGTSVYNRFYHDSDIEYHIVNILTNSEKSWLNYFCSSSRIPLSKSVSKFL